MPNHYQQLFNILAQKKVGESVLVHSFEERTKLKLHSEVKPPLLTPKCGCFHAPSIAIE